MEIGKFRLIATDLDGTLLRKDESVSERTRQALQRVRAAGATVVLVSGRPPRTLQLIAQKAGVTGLAVCSNGAIIYDLEQEQIVESWPIAPEVTSRLIVQLREAAPGILFALELGTRYGREPGYPIPRMVLPQGFDPVVEDALVLCREPAVKLIARHTEFTTEALAELISRVAGETVLVTYSGVGFIEISAAGVHKAWALEKLCARLGISASEVIAFGDMPNDIPMLAWAGHGVAMSNAHPEVLQQANEITLSNMEDGVAVVLDRLLDEGRLGKAARQRVQPLLKEAAD
jgi:Cof subfamily protein (haloacid dehalogenase superfamily)